MADRKQNVVNALRGLADSFGQLSRAHQIAQAAISEYSQEIEHSEGSVLANLPPLFGNLESFGAAAPASGSKVKAKGEDGVDAVNDDGKKKRGPNKEKKVKDPNAPKRPASAYIEYQNDVRDAFRERHADLPYSEVLKKIGESWGSLTDEQKQPYVDITERKKETYLTDKKAYEAEHGPPQTIPTTGAASADDKAYSGKKRGRKSNAERALIAAAAATEAGRGETSNAKHPQGDIPVNAPSAGKKTAEDSDDDSDDSEEESEEESDESEEESSDNEPTPPPVAVPSKKEKKVKADKHKTKKNKTA
ncbi:uncharacterized protein JCM15063_003166 [Sporobolomyces koalae]|uniref:uncharacterized protein n=1 Tax=Sporobolomyces koalae TaxID=500713 RepID=UPI00317F7DD7